MTKWNILSCLLEQLNNLNYFISFRQQLEMKSLLMEEVCHIIMEVLLQLILLVTHCVVGIFDSYICKRRKDTPVDYGPIRLLSIISK